MTDAVEYERRLAARDARIVQLMAENAELANVNFQLSEILRSAAIAVAGENVVVGGASAQAPADATKRPAVPTGHAGDRGALDSGRVAADVNVTTGVDG